MNLFFGDSIAFLAGDDRWILYNVRTKTALGLDGASLSAFGTLQSPGSDRLKETGPFRVWDVSWFSQTGGTLDDPTRICRDPDSWQEPRILGKEAFFAELTSRWLAISDYPAYQRNFERPAHPLDKMRLGNFHDQLGRHLLFERRTDPSEWWIGQKFKDDGTVRTDNPYGTVQWPALVSYFEARLTKGLRVLDVGCGTGVFAREIARHGAEVVGIDPSDKYLAIAHSYGTGNCSYFPVPLGTDQGFEKITDESFDIVFMSDALLFSFVSISPRDVVDPSMILSEIRRVLKPGGAFISVEPHGDFYLAPWLGAENAPWTVLYEHRSRHFSTAPVFGQSAKAVLKTGFALVHFEELYRANNCVSGNMRMDEFTGEFPLWTLTEYRKD